MEYKKKTYQWNYIIHCMTLFTCNLERNYEYKKKEEDYICIQWEKKMFYSRHRHIDIYIYIHGQGEWRKANIYIYIVC